MQIAHLWHKLNIHWHKIVVLGVLLLLVNPVKAQNNPTDHLPDYDEHRVHYGFLLGFHSSKFRVQYADQYATPKFDTLHSVIPGNLPGVKIGMPVNLHLFQFLDFRVIPTVSFYEYDLTYRYTNRTELRYIKDATIVELPLLLKYKAQRRGNYAMYLVGGLKPSFEWVGTVEKGDTSTKLDLKKTQVSIDLGVGFDIYFPMFKFSPEIRYSYGLRNMLDKSSNSEFNAPLKKLTIHNINFFISFEGGPSTISGAEGRRPNRKKGAPNPRKKIKMKGSNPRN